MTLRNTVFLLLPALIVLISGCAAVQERLGQRTPEASVDGVRLAGLGFDGADLLVDVRLDNPNPVGIRLAGMNYELRLDGERALSGESDQRMEVPANDSGMVSVPITLAWAELEERISSLRGRDQVEYALDLGIDVDVPVLGVRRLSASTSDTLPVPKWPRVSLRDVRIEQLGLGGARVLVDLGVNNPNRFGLDLDALRYDLQVDGRDWASGSLEEAVRVGAGDSTTLSIPVQLDFGALGTGLYRMLTEGGALDYQLRGSLAGTAGESRLGRFEFDFDDRGDVTPEN